MSGTVKFPTTVEFDKSEYGVEMSILFPLSGNKVDVCQDVFGELEEKCQIIIYTCSEDDPAILVRFDDDGTIAEVCLSKETAQKIVPIDTNKPTRWLIQRDGC